MTAPRRTRYEPTWTVRSPTALWIDHATVTEHDFDRLRDVEELTVWNVRFPDGFLGRLPRLWFLDVRGGSARDVRVIDGCERLRGLVVNQVRGLHDLSALGALRRLELLSLYGLAQVESLPPLGQLEALRRIEIGQMRTLRDWSPLLELPVIEELILSNKLTPDGAVMKALAQRGRLKSFLWDAESGASDRAVASLEVLFALPKARTMFPRDWFHGDPAPS